MHWKGRRESRNVEDRRGRGRRRAAGGVGLGGVVLLLAYVLLGGKPEDALEALSAQQSPMESSTRPSSRAEDELAAMVSVVLADTESVWGSLFDGEGATYQPPKLVLFTDSVSSACGYTSAAVGPFYCPADQKAYIDLSFYRELAERFGAPGDFAQAYVLAHEVGHHVQNLTGVSQSVRRQQQGLPAREANRLSVGLELQADCFAGVWAHHANRERQLLEPGDLEEGLAAAAAIGDDRLQRQTQGRVVPETWTHGSSDQRVHWFRTGFESGSIHSCDTAGVEERGPRR